jgi:CelD/BcsL family acetyltransferase involved in cellulose biosynthesis
VTNCGLDRRPVCCAGARVERRAVLEPLRDLAEIGDADWDALARGCGNLFGTREWVTTWWEVFGDRGSLLSFACREPNGRLMALLPMYVRAGRATRELRLLGHGLADRLGPICASRDRSQVADAMRLALSETRALFDLFVGDDLPEHEGWGAALGARQVRRTSSPVLRADGRRFNEFLATRSRNFRQQARHRERALIRAHGLRYRLTEDPSRLPADLDQLFQLHEARWGGVTRSFAGARAAFHRMWAAKALERGWLRLWIAELDGQPAAAWYGFRYDSAEWYYQAGRDPRHDHLSIGFVLLLHTIRAALDDGIGEYHLLRGDEPYKHRFANDDVVLESVEIASENLAGSQETAAVHV